MHSELREKQKLYAADWKLIVIMETLNSHKMQKEKALLPLRKKQKIRTTVKISFFQHLHCCSMRSKLSQRKWRSTSNERKQKKGSTKWQVSWFSVNQQTYFEKEKAETSFMECLLVKTLYCFCIFVNKHFINAHAYVSKCTSKCKRCYNAKLSTYYFYMRTNIPLSFLICISVLLSSKKSCAKKRRKENVIESLLLYVM